MVRVPRQRNAVQRFFTSEYVYDGVVACGTFAGAGISLWKGVATSDGFAYFFFAAALFVFLATCGRLVIKHRQREELDSPHSLEGALHTLHGLLQATVSNLDQNDPHLRVTVHVPVRGGQELEQVMNYVGDQRAKGTTARRRFRAQSGIIGRAFREKEVFVGSRVNNDFEPYIRELVSDWSYTDEDARKLNPASHAWMAIPLFVEEEQQADAVVYMDSTTPGFFDDETRQQLSILCCDGISRFLKQRYS